MSSRSSRSKRLYRILAVKYKCSQEEILSAFRRLSMTYHPDRNPGDESAAEKFREVQLAYDILGHEDRRKAYDITGEEVGSIADATLTKHMPMILDIWNYVVSDMIENDGDPKLNDMLKKFDEKCTELTTKAQTTIRNFQKMADGFREIGERIKCDGEDNPLSAAMLSKADTYQKHVEGAKRELAIIIKSAELVKEYKYEFIRQIGKEYPFTNTTRTIHFVFGNR